jgi:hypothetical protein
MSVDDLINICVALCNSIKICVVALYTATGTGTGIASPEDRVNNPKS